MSTEIVDMEVIFKICKTSAISEGPHEIMNNTTITIIIKVTFLAVFIASACLWFWLFPSPGTFREQSL